jgi:hypothetical protein
MLTGTTTSRTASTASTAKTSPAAKVWVQIGPTLRGTLDISLISVDQRLCHVEIDVVPSLISTGIPLVGVLYLFLQTASPSDSCPPG